MTEKPPDATRGPFPEDRRKKDTGLREDIPGLLKYADFDYGAFLKRRNVRVLVVLVFVALALVVGWLLSEIFVPLIAALIIAYILNPLVVKLQKFGMGRGAATTVIFIGFFAFTTLMLLLIIPGLLSNISDFTRDMGTYPAKIDGLARNAIAFSNDRFGTSLDPEKLQIDKMITSMFGSQGGESSPAAQNMAAEAVATGIDATKQTLKTLIGWLLFITLVPLYTFFFLKNLDSIWNWTAQHLPGKHRARLLRIFAEIHQMASAFFRGRLIICGIVAVATTILLVIFKVPMAVVLGLLGGFGVIIPLFPMIASLTPAVLLMLMKDAPPSQIALMAGIFLAIQGIEQFILTPKILGKAVELHPVTLIVGVFVMFQIFGLFGALLAVPLTCIAKILAREFISPYFKALAAESPDGSRTGVMAIQPPPKG